MNIAVNSLLVKATHNHEAGAWAENQGYFDVAVSRYYYALFQKTLFILEQQPGYKQPEQAYNSHNKVIDDLNRVLFSQLKDEEIQWLVEMRRLKKCRVNADYEQMILSAHDFDLGFKYGYNRIKELLDRRIGGKTQ